MAITTTGSGNWSSTTPNAPWPGGTVPGAADAVTIASGHTVTLDTTGCVCLSLTVNSGGTLTCTTAATWDFTVGNATGDTINIVAAAGTTVNLDMSAAASYTGTIYLNKGANTSGLGIACSSTSTVTLKGSARKRLTRLNGAITAGATSATVDDATGWAIGDLIVLGTTQPYNATPRIDVVTLTSVSGTSIGWSGGITYDHADDGYVGNFSSNLTIRPYGTNRAYCAIDSQTGITITDVAFNGLSDSTAFGKYGLSVNDGPTTGGILNNNAFYTTHSNAVNILWLRFLRGTWSRSDNVIYGTYGTAINGQGASGYIGNWDRVAIFRAANNGFNLQNPGEHFIDGVVMACLSSGAGGVAYGGYGCKVVNCSIIACNNGIYSPSGVLPYAQIVNSKIGTEFGAYNGSMIKWDGVGFYQTIDCKFQTSGTLLNGLVSTSKPTYTGVVMVNKNLSVASQEEYYPHCEIKRDNSEIYRSTSGMSITPVRVSTDCQRTLSIPCANGSSIRVIGYVQKSHATNVSATVALTGLGSSVTPFTKANDTAWEQYDLSATNSSGNDGNFTLTYTANSSSGTTNVVYFDGVPDSPFVTKCRHYGFLFDESSPVRTVDTYASAAEATAIAYTGVTITNATKLISFAAGTADTAQKFYDYSRAWSVSDLDYQVPFTRAGTLYSMTTGWTVVDPYYAGDLTWSGGTVQYTTTGTKSDNLDGCIVEFDAVGTFTFDGTLSGTLDLRNLGASAITVELPSGTSYITANNTGGTITVSTPQVYQSVTLTGVIAGSRVQIYDVTNATELFNDTSVYAWTDGTPAAGNRAIRVRISYVSGTSAKEFIEASIGTCGTTEPSNAVTYLVNQTNDVIYNSNAIDGSAVTGITFTDAATDLVNINVASNSVTWPTIYAAFCYWIFTEAGIADDIAYIQARDTANYTLTSMQIKNTSSPSEPLVVSGGYGVDASTGQTLTLVDTSGGTLVFAPDHVVPFQTTGTYAITGDISTVLAAIPAVDDIMTDPRALTVAKFLGLK